MLARPQSTRPRAGITRINAKGCASRSWRRPRPTILASTGAVMFILK